MPRIRVLIVEDSLTVRKRIGEALSADGEMEVVGEAEDGKTGIELCRRLRPDVVTLDMLLPGLSGLAVTEYIMAYFPTPILIVSSSTNRGELYRTCDALAAGALDVLEKPSADQIPGDWEKKLVSMVELVSRVRVITHVRGRRPADVRAPASPAMPPGNPRTGGGPYRVMAVGASTGGPAALVEILRGLPSDFPLPILAVIHIADSFGGMLAESLDKQSSLRVRCAVDGEALPEVGQGRVIMAAPGRHLLVSQGRLRLSDQPERHSCKPSVDVLFESLAREAGTQSIACLLTGMGKDGAEGLLAIRQAGGRTLAQDEATSAVFGMPQAAIRIGAAEHVLALPQIARAVAALAAVKSP